MHILWADFQWTRPGRAKRGSEKTGKMLTKSHSSLVLNMFFSICMMHNRDGLPWEPQHIRGNILDSTKIQGSVVLQLFDDLISPGRKVGSFFERRYKRKSPVQYAEIVPAWLILSRNIWAFGNLCSTADQISCFEKRTKSKIMRARKPSSSNDHLKHHYKYARIRALWSVCHNL